jgi:hypothetical protein
MLEGRMLQEGVWENVTLFNAVGIVKEPRLDLAFSSTGSPHEGSRLS